MEPEKKLSICIAEFPLGQDRYHAALLLIEEGGDDLCIVQHLHFGDYEETTNGKPNGIYRMIPYVRNGMSSDNVESIKHLYPVIGGYERDTLEAWNHILAHAIEVREQNIPFDYEDRHLPHARNCRMGVVSALKSIGINTQGSYPPEDRIFLGQAGTVSDSISISYVFDFYSEARQDLKTVREQNANLSEVLPRPKEEGEKDMDTILIHAATHLAK